jgi:hypothetical protein
MERLTILEWSEWCTLLLLFFVLFCLPTFGRSYFSFRSQLITVGNYCLDWVDLLFL